ncbi:MAG: SO2930 family diheme c-type cytochrome [Caulobacteraceae bacterium]
MKLAALGALCVALLLAAAAPAPSPVDVARLLDETPAPTLADYHLFTDAGARAPNAGLTPYDLNTPLFSDYALKRRYIFLPPGTSARYTAEGPLDFPVGATLVKTFAFPTDFRHPDQNVRFIETRLLIRRAGGWSALAYVWNAAQTQAVLKRAGLRAPVSFIDAAGAARAIDYEVPNVNQCKECHGQGGQIVPLGPKARNLNGAYPYAKGSENQLVRWTRLGLLTGAPDPAAAPRTPRWDDPRQPLEGRARAYLDVNCGHCHNGAGLASNSGLYLTFEETDPARLGVGKRPVAAGRGSAGLLFDIDPGHPERSILPHRMASTEVGVMMPQIGRTLAHREGVALIAAYIAAMPAPQGIGAVNHR